jgi:D-glycero-beta-D-manno-heptose 1-phosphate adenylyltransferase
MSTLLAIQSKILDQNQLQYRIGSWRAKGYSVVFTNGCFDILHTGHIHYLAEAADKGAYLVVGINSDSSVIRQGKGPNRPVNNQDARAFVLAGVHGVAAVCIFYEDTPLELIKTVKPDILVKGGDYDENETNSSSKKYIVGSDLVKSYGGKVETIPFVEGFSTTQTIQKLTGK